MALAPGNAKLELSHARTERFYVKLALGAFLAIILLVALIWGWRESYIRWQERQLVRRATLDIGQGNLAGANLAARSLLDMKPSSAAAARIMAALAESIGDRSALDWRRKATEAEPNSVNDVLALVRSAVQFSDIVLAERALAGVDEKARKTAPYHAASAMVAQSKHEVAKAEAEWSEALRLSPDDRFFELQLGVVRLRSNDPQQRVKGEATLRALRADPIQRSAATRALINAGLERHDALEKLLELTGELQAYPEATWIDRFAYLNLLHQLQDPRFTQYLTELEKTAPNSASSLAELLSWMSKNNLGLLALDYSKSLPREALEKWPVPLAIADTYVQLRDWRNLEVFTAKANWGQFDFLQHAYLSLALRNEGKSAEAGSEWTSAQKEASSQPQLLSTLSQVISDWGWEEEKTELLWALSKQPQTQLKALQALYQKYANAGDTPDLYRIIVRLMELLPDDLRIQNNFAQISLILNVNTDRARRIASELYRKERSSSAYASTYAFSLYTRGDKIGASKVMGALGDTQLNDPSVAAYYGLFLAAVGEKQKAREYFRIGASAKLLPEERALIAEAQSSLK
jgi:hypothetical protein